MPVVYDDILPALPTDHFPGDKLYLSAADADRLLLDAASHRVVCHIYFKPASTTIKAPRLGLVKQMARTGGT